MGGSIYDKSAIEREIIDQESEVFEYIKKCKDLGYENIKVSDDAECSRLYFYVIAFSKQGVIMMANFRYSHCGADLQDFDCSDNGDINIGETVLSFGEVGKLLGASNGDC